MRLGAVLVRSRGWSSIRRVLLATLALVVLALQGGITPRIADARAPIGSLLVYFSGATRPPVCKAQAYKIFAQPFVLAGGNSAIPLVSSRVRVLPASLGTIFPTLSFVTTGGPAVFVYKSDKTGQETLQFTASLLQVFKVTGEATEANSPLVNENLSFEVVECPYKVTLNFSWQANMGGVNMVQFGYQAETKLEPKANGQFEGNGSFKFTQLENIPPCSASLSDFDIPTSITGKLVASTPDGTPDTLELSFKWGKGTMKANINCPEVGGGSRSHEMDASTIFAPSAKFSALRRDTKVLPTKGSLQPPGKLTITVVPVPAGN